MKALKLTLAGAYAGLVFVLMAVSPSSVAAPDTKEMPIYKPSDVGTPTRRIGGGARLAIPSPRELF
ncbi:MAG: hypothetical protein GY862_11005 [Gammaproteobacteria bacterium]|nr:hypothetical protein [Gammaproteobacteria bacterium]